VHSFCNGSERAVAYATGSRMDKKIFVVHRRLREVAGYCAGAFSQAESSFDRLTSASIETSCGCLRNADPCQSSFL
jgi:hypothetical protein